MNRVKLDHFARAISGIGLLLLQVILVTSPAAADDCSNWKRLCSGEAGTYTPPPPAKPKIFVSSASKIGEGVEFGDCVEICGNSTIGSNVKLGPNTSIIGAQVGDESRVEYSTVGERTVLGRYSKVAHAKIGRDNIFGSSATIGFFSEVGNGNKIGSGFSASGGVGIGNNNLIESNILLLRYVKLGNENKLGRNSLVREGVKVGNGSMVESGFHLDYDLGDEISVGKDDHFIVGVDPHYMGDYPIDPSCNLPEKRTIFDELRQRAADMSLASKLLSCYRLSGKKESDIYDVLMEEIKQQLKLEQEYAIRQHEKNHDDNEFQALLKSYNEAAGEKKSEIDRCLPCIFVKPAKEETVLTCGKSACRPAFWHFLELRDTKTRDRYCEHQLRGPQKRSLRKWNI